MRSWRWCSHDGIRALLRRAAKGFPCVCVHQGRPSRAINRKRAHTRTQPRWYPAGWSSRTMRSKFCLSHLIHGLLLRQPELTKADLEARSDSGRKWRQKYLTVMTCAPAGSHPKANNIWLSLCLWCSDRLVRGSSSGSETLMTPTLALSLNAAE